MAGSEAEEDDYMSMAFDDSTTGSGASVPETSLQRRQRLKREAEIRGRPKPKAELAAEEAAAREAALGRSLLESQAAHKSKGLAMLKKMGFRPGGALGAPDNADARQEPIRPSLKEDRGGIGLDRERKRKVDEAAVGDEGAGEGQPKKAKVVDPLEYRERLRRENEVARWEKQVHAAQKVAERMDEESEAERAAEGEDTAVNGKRRTLSTRPLKSIPVIWRGLVRHREERERDRRMRHDLEQSLSRLPTYEDDDADADDLRALGKADADKGHVPVEDLEEEDAELDEFNALEPDERLRRLVEHLRRKHRYCFWCKCAYPDDEMDGCPGLTEDDHD